MSERQAKKARKEAAIARELYSSMMENKPSEREMTPNHNGYYKGNWGGAEGDVYFKVIYAKLLPFPEKPMHWQNAFADTIQQIVLINSGGQVWAISNIYGEGVYKLTDGLGSPRCGHASVEGFEDMGDVPKDEWIIYSRLEADVWQARVSKYQQETCPEEYEKLQALKASFSKNKW